MGITLDNRRLVIAYNPHSSRATAVKRNVFDSLDKAGYKYETIEVKQASVADNVARLAPLIQPGDIILSAAGDGSAHAVMNTVLEADQPGVELGFLAFGNFNDAPHIFNTKDSLKDPVAFLEHAKPQRVSPLTIYVDDAPLRSALLYVSLGWTAQAAQQFDDPAVRAQLKQGGGGMVKNLLRLGVYYFKTRRSSVLPSFRHNDETYTKTDIICANGPDVARLFHSGKSYYKTEVFLFRMLDVRSLVKNIPFLLSGLVGKMKGSEESSVRLDFPAPSSLTMQCDGEIVELKDVTTITIEKSAQTLSVLSTR